MVTMDDNAIIDVPKKRPTLYILDSRRSISMRPPETSQAKAKDTMSAFKLNIPLSIMRYFLESLRTIYEENNAKVNIMATNKLTTGNANSNKSGIGVLLGLGINFLK